MRDKTIIAVIMFLIGYTVGILTCNWARAEDGLNGCPQPGYVLKWGKDSAYPTERVKRALKIALTSYDMHSVFLWGAVKTEEDKIAYKGIIKRYQDDIKFIEEVYQEILNYEEEE